MPKAPRQPKAPKAPKVKKSDDEKRAAKEAAAADKAAADAAFKAWVTDMKYLHAPIFDVTTKKGRADSKTYFDIQGFSVNYCFDGEPHVQAYCERVLPVMVDATMRGCHYDKTRMDTVPLFDSKKQLDDLMNSWKGSETFKGMHKDLRDSWYPHCTFGAPASAEAFNCPTMHDAQGWDCLWKWATAAFNGDFAYPTNDRLILKPTGLGENCFLHLDMTAPWFRYPADAEGPPEFKQVLGKLALSHGQTFIAVPRSHLQHEEVARLYKEFYPNASAKHAKWALDPRKGDPLGLFPGTVKIVVPRGCWISWDPKLFHGVVANQKATCSFGLYLGFTNNIERPAYERVTGVDEVTDRYNVWRYGDAPLAFPSCDKVHFLPHKFQNFPAGMLSYIRKCDRNDPGLRFFNRPLVLDPTRTAATVEQVRNVDHVPPCLSATRRAKLVGAHNVHKFDFDSFPTRKRARTK